MSLIMDPINVKILVVLKNGKRRMTYTKIVHKSGIPLGTLAIHLDSLLAAGLVEDVGYAVSKNRHPNVAKHCYRICNGKVSEAMKKMDELLEPLRS
jgi:DNA-binding transcriptional ArsR family regulator